VRVFEGFGPKLEHWRAPFWMVASSPADNEEEKLESSISRKRKNLQWKLKIGSED